MASCKDAAHAFGVSPRTVSRWCANGMIESANKIGAQWRIPEDTIERYLEDGLSLTKEEA